MFGKEGTDGGFEGDGEVEEGTAHGGGGAGSRAGAARKAPARDGRRRRRGARRRNRGRAAFARRAAFGRPPDGDGEMARMVAHEVRNALSVMVNVATGLRRTVPRTLPDTEMLLGILEEELSRLDRLTHDLVSFATPAPPIRADVRIRELLDRAGEEARARCPGGARATVSVEVPPRRRRPRWIRTACSRRWSGWCATASRPATGAGRCGSWRYGWATSCRSTFWTRDRGFRPETPTASSTRSTRPNPRVSDWASLCAGRSPAATAGTWSPSRGPGAGVRFRLSIPLGSDEG